MHDFPMYYYIPNVIKKYSLYVCLLCCVYMYCMAIKLIHCHCHCHCHCHVMGLKCYHTILYVFSNCILPICLWCTNDIYSCFFVSFFISKLYMYVDKYGILCIFLEACNKDYYYIIVHIWKYFTWTLECWLVMGWNYRHIWACFTKDLMF